LSFPTRNAIAKLAQVHGLSKKGESLKSSAVLKVHPVAVTCERLKSPKPPFGGRKSGTPETSKARKDRSRRPKKIQKPQWTPELVEGIQKLREEFSLLRRQSLTVLLRKEGFTVSSSTVGRILRYLKPRGLLKEGEKPRRVSLQKAHGRIKDPMPRESPETPKVVSPGTSSPSIPQKSPPSWKGVEGIPAKASFLRGLLHPWSGGTAQSDLPGGFSGPPRMRWTLEP